MKELVHIYDKLNDAFYTVCTRSGRIVAKEKIEFENLFDENHNCKLRDTCLDGDCDFANTECERFFLNVKKVELQNFTNVCLMPKFFIISDEVITEMEVEP